MLPLVPKAADPLSIAEFTALAEKIGPLVGVERSLCPGAEFGPLHGQVKGEIGDFAWVNPWTVLVRAEICDRLRSRDINLCTSQLLSSHLEGGEMSLLEIEAAPVARLHDSARPEQCDECGRFSLIGSRPLAIAKASFNLKVTVQRIREIPTMLLVSEPLALVIEEMGLRDVVVHELSVV